jgi:hypothetical protein
MSSFYAGSKMSSFHAESKMSILYAGRDSELTQRFRQRKGKLSHRLRWSRVIRSVSVIAILKRDSAIYAVAIPLFIPDDGLSL